MLCDVGRRLRLPLLLNQLVLFCRQGLEEPPYLSLWDPKAEEGLCEKVCEFFEDFLALWTLILGKQIIGLMRRKDWPIRIPCRNPSEFSTNGSYTKTSRTMKWCS